MIADIRGNNQNSLFGTLTKKALGLLPESAPSRIYNTALKIPVARAILSAYVRRLIPEKISTPAGVMHLDRADMAVSGALAFGKFEPFETELFKTMIKPGMNAVDIGAHIGYYAVIAARFSGPNGKVFAFEPEPKNFSLLTQNINENAPNQIIAINTALSDTSGTRDLFLEKYNKGHHSFAQNSQSAQTISVKTMTLDQALKELGGPQIHVIKIDVEGAEPIILRGMKETIGRSPNMIIFTEVYPRSMAKMGESAESYLNELVSLGFSLSIIDEGKKTITPVSDIPAFISSFPSGESFKNILGIKGVK